MKDVAKYRDAPVDAGGADVERGECRDEVLIVAHKKRKYDVVVAKDVLHGAQMGMKMYSTKRTGPM